MELDEGNPSLQRERPSLDPKLKRLSDQVDATPTKRELAVAYAGALVSRL